MKERGLECVTVRECDAFIISSASFLVSQDAAKPSASSSRSPWHRTMCAPPSSCHGLIMLSVY